MRTSDSVAAIQKAIIMAAPQFLSVTKNKQGYGYKYATLDSVIDLLREVLPKHGLWFTQFPTTTEGKPALLTRVYHESGEWMESAIEMTDTDLSGKANDTQKMGASITYYRRYALTSIFGIAADEDVDGIIRSKQPVQSQSQSPVQSQSPQTAERVIERELTEGEKQRIERARKYLLANQEERLKAGEPKLNIERSYADLLETRIVRPLEMLPKELIPDLANAVRAQIKSQQKVKQ